MNDWYHSALTRSRLAFTHVHRHLLWALFVRFSHDVVRMLAMRRRLLPLLLPLLLGGCLSFSSSDPPPPAHNTTIVVPPGSTVTCPNGSAPPC